MMPHRRAACSNTGCRVRAQVRGHLRIGDRTQQSTCSAPRPRSNRIAVAVRSRNAALVAAELGEHRCAGSCAQSSWCRQSATRWFQLSLVCRLEGERPHVGGGARCGCRRARSRPPAMPSSRESAPARRRHARIPRWRRRCRDSIASRRRPSARRGTRMDSRDPPTFYDLPDTTCAEPSCVRAHDAAPHRSAPSCDEVGASAHGVIHFAGRARNVVARRLAAAQHATGVRHLLIIEGLGQAIVECVPAKVAPEIPTATQIFSVPVDLRIITELETYRRSHIASRESRSYSSRADRLVVGLRLGQTPLSRRGENFAFQLSLVLKSMPSFCCCRAGKRNFMLIVAEHDKLPVELGELRPILDA